MKSAVIVFSVFCFAFAARATITITPWSPIFQGIDTATGDADASEPVLQHIVAMRVDLSNTNVSFFSTPSNGTNSLETFGQTTGKFMSTYGVQVAINANFFSPCCDTTPNEPKDLLGLAISQGNLVSPQTNSGAGSVVLSITRSNQASIVVTSSTISTSNIYTAVAGSGVLVKNGANTGAMDTLNPRTAVGISQNQRYLYMIVIDGRETDHSAGATLFDTGAWLVRFGTYNGLNLDGGGSTAMLKSVSGVPTVLNQPSDGAQRVVGNNFGVFALPFVPPAFTATPSNQVVVSGVNVTFSAAVTGSSPLIYQWKINGTNISAATNSAFALLNVRPVNSATYSVTVSNTVGKVTASASLTVQPAAAPQITSVSVMPDGRLHFSFTGSTSVNYLIDATSNLVNWVTVANVAAVNGQFDFIDSNSTNFPNRFYRVRWAP